MSIKIRVLQFKRGLLDRLTAAGILPGEPAIAWDDDTKPRLLIGDRMGVPRELAAPAHVHLISSITGLQAALDAKGWAGAPVDYSQLVNLPATYPPPVATEIVLGGIKPGLGVAVSPTGILTVTHADEAGSVAWVNVSGRPTVVSAFANDAGYLTAITGPMVVAALGFTPAAGNVRASVAITLDGPAGTVDLGKSFRIEGETASAPGRFRLYRTATGRDADLARAAGTDAPMSVGMLLEDTFTADALVIAAIPAPGAPSGSLVCAWSWDGPAGTTLTLDVLKLDA